MGEVYRARDTRLRREVALKLLPDAAAHDADSLHRFDRETRAVATLNHPEHPGDPRHRLLPRRALRRDGAARRRDPARPPARRAAASAEGGRGRQPDRRGPRRGAREGHHPPRHQARQHLPDQRGPREDPRLRHRAHRAAGPDVRPLRHHHRARADRARSSSSGRPATCPPSRSAASRSTGAPTSSRSARPSSRCSPAGAPSCATARSRPSAPSCATTRASTPRPRRSRTSCKGFVFRCLEKDPADRYQSARDLLLDLRALQAEQLRQASERVTFRSEPPWKHRRTRVWMRAVGGDPALRRRPLRRRLLGARTARSGGSGAGELGAVTESPPAAVGAALRPPGGLRQISRRRPGGASATASGRRYADARPASMSAPWTGSPACSAFGVGIGPVQHASLHASYSVRRWTGV